MSLTDQQLDELARMAESGMKFEYNADFFNEAVDQLEIHKETKTVPSWVVPSMVATLLFAGSSYMIYQINTNDNPTIGNYTEQELPIKSLTQPEVTNEDDVTEAIVAPLKEQVSKEEVLSFKETEAATQELMPIQQEVGVAATDEIVQPVETVEETPVITKPVIEENKATDKSKLILEKGTGGKKSLIPVLEEDEDSTKTPSEFGTAKKKEKKVIPPDWN